MKESAEVQIYTEKQRLAIYIIALEWLKRDMEDENRSIGGFCYYIANAMESYTEKKGMRTWIFFSGHNPIEYPEFLAFKPKKLYSEDFWFSQTKRTGGAKRVEILETIIADMQNKSPKL